MLRTMLPLLSGLNLTSRFRSYILAGVACGESDRVSTNGREADARQGRFNCPRHGRKFNPDYELLYREIAPATLNVMA